MCVCCQGRKEEIAALKKEEGAFMQQLNRPTSKTVKLNSPSTHPSPQSAPVVKSAAAGIQVMDSTDFDDLD